MSRIGFAVAAGTIAGSMLLGASLGAAATGLLSVRAAVANVVAMSTAAFESVASATDDDGPDSVAPDLAPAPSPAPTAVAGEEPQV